MIPGKLYDLKVGYSCNNNCEHCVIKYNKRNLVKCGNKIDSSYGDILDYIDSEDFGTSSCCTITGGEPTLRKDFMRIIKYIVRKYPNMKICLQTNGRLLWKYVEELKGLTENINYVVAIHSIDKEVHNKIVNSKTGNPYEETFNSLNKIKEVYGSFKDTARIEIVLSSMNYKTIPNTIKKLYEMGIDRIGISYPHLDGFYYNDGVDEVRRVGLSYKQLREIIPSMYKFAESHKKLYLEVEEFPRCVFRDEKGNLLKRLSNFYSMGGVNPGGTSVKFPGEETQSNFNDVWLDMHEKGEVCNNCVLYNRCCGVWFESVKAYECSGLEPVLEKDTRILDGSEYGCL